MTISNQLIIRNLDFLYYIQSAVKVNWYWSYRNETHAPINCFAGLPKNVSGCTILFAWICTHPSVACIGELLGRGRTFGDGGRGI